MSNSGLPSIGVLYISKLIVCKFEKWSLAERSMLNVFLRSLAKSWDAVAWTNPVGAHGKAIAGIVNLSGNFWAVVDKASSS
jgi:hypothetical protein